MAHKSSTRSSRRLSKSDMEYDLDDLDELTEEESDDLSDLLDEESEDEEVLEEPDLASTVKSIYKALDERDEMLLELAKSMRVLAKRVMELERTTTSATTTTTSPSRRMSKDASPTESDFSPTGSGTDLGTPEGYASTESLTPGLTSGEPQGIAAKGRLAKDDKWSNFGEKDSDIPGNAPVVPDTKEWPGDQTVVDGSGGGLSGMAPSGVKGIAKSLEALHAQVSAIEKALQSVGIVYKAAAPTVGAGAPGQDVDLADLEERARQMSFRELNRLRAEMGEL